MEFDSTKFKSSASFFFAKKCLSFCLDEDAFYSLYYLFKAYFYGHLCIYFDGKSLNPDPRLLLDEEEKIDEEKIINGFSFFSNEIYQTSSSEISFKPIVKEGNHYYVQRNFLLEESILADVQRLYGKTPALFFPKERIKQMLISLDLKINEDQKNAIVSTLSSSFHLLTGGPGTGKSYTVKALIQTFIALCKEIEFVPRILITAPTGKATATLKERLSKEGFDEGAHVDIGTLHSILKIKKQGAYPATFFYDLVIVDESSMVDFYLWKVFLSSLKVGSSVLIMGDHNQLPPVESGMVFFDLIKVLCCSHLEKCMRVENLPLLSLARAIKEGNKKEAERYLFSSSDPTIYFYEINNESALLNLPQFEDFLDKFIKEEKFVFLTPFNQGPFGTKALNETILATLLRQSKKQLKIPIMITKTDYELSLFNGDCGYLIKPFEGLSEFAFFMVDGEEKKIPLSLIKEYDLAYCISIHKSQGSEYDSAAVFLSEGAHKFGKEVFYTAITRVKKELKVFSSRQTIDLLLKKEGNKYSALYLKLQKRIYHESSC